MPSEVRAEHGEIQPGGAQATAPSAQREKHLRQGVRMGQREWRGDWKPKTGRPTARAAPWAEGRGVRSVGPGALLDLLQPAAVHLAAADDVEAQRAEAGQVSVGQNEDDIFEGQHLPLVQAD